MHSGSAGGYKDPNLFLLVTIVTIIIVLLWDVHIKSHASDLASLSPVMF